MKIAYLIMIHNNPIHLKRLINSLNTKDVDFYIHIDKKTKRSFNLPKYDNVIKIKNNIPIFWGGFSQVQASINLLKEAKKNRKYDYYILLSGVDYPVRSNNYIHNFFKKYKGKEFINLYPMPLYDKTFDRIEYYRYEGSRYLILSYIIRLLNMLIKKFHLKRDLPHKYSDFKLYAGSNWWGLTDKSVNYIIKFIKNNSDFIKFYQNTLCPDEMFFHTILGNSSYLNNIMNSFMFTDWSGDIKPALINQNHLSILKKEFINTDFGNKKSYILFARKFSDKNKTITDYIDKTLRLK